MAKTVCIVGAGPSGLVSAKTLVHDHPKDTFHVTVFEQSQRIGGLWPISKVDDGMVNPDMCTNQSRHTVSFSDLAWPESGPAFPKAWQVGEYLQRYIKTYPGYEIRTNCKVLKTESQSGRWKVQVQDGTSTSPETLDFDHMIVATGFFGKPKVPEILKDLPVPVIHSSELRDVRDLLTKNRKTNVGTRRNIVVVGGQMSGVETAASIAFQLSSDFASLGEDVIPDAQQYSVCQVVQEPFWVMPLFFPKDPVVDVPGQHDQKKNNNSPTFLPLDLIAYNLAVRPPGPIQNTSGHITPEAAAITHNFMNTFIGSDQSQLASVNDLAMQGDVRFRPPWLTVSDQYNEFVRSGKIRTYKGKVVSPLQNRDCALALKDGYEDRAILDVATVVFATGFDAAPSLDFIPKDILKDLKFDPTSDKFPLALNVHSTVSRDYPSLGFVGFYRSPYWGVMEMQARFLGKLWSGDSKAAEALAEDKTMHITLKLRNNPRAAQFPMGDYAYLMESFSEILGIRRTEPEGTSETARTGIVQPSRYIYDTASEAQKKEASSALSIIDQIFSDSATTGKYVPRAIFRAMQGIWNLERVIESRRSDYPSGTLSGVAYFHPRVPTDDTFDMEYLYREKGDFISGQGFTFSATRSYAYRYCEAKDKLSAWFVIPKDNKTVDYLFHELDVILPEKDSNPLGEKPWRAKSSHLCIDDMYNVKYEFRFKGVALESWSQEYTVNGPAKDYTIKNVYRRPELAVGNKPAFIL